MPIGGSSSRGNPWLLAWHAGTEQYQSQGRRIRCMQNYYTARVLGPRCTCCGLVLVVGGASLGRSPMELGLGSQDLTVVTLASMYGCSNGIGLEMIRYNGRSGSGSKMQSSTAWVWWSVSSLVPMGQSQVCSSMTPFVVCYSHVSGSRVRAVAAQPSSDGLEQQYKTLHRARGSRHCPGNDGTKSGSGARCGARAVAAPSHVWCAVVPHP